MIATIRCASADSADSVLLTFAAQYREQDSCSASFCGSRESMWSKVLFGFELAGARMAEEMVNDEHMVSKLEVTLVSTSKGKQNSKSQRLSRGARLAKEEEESQNGPLPIDTNGLEDTAAEKQPQGTDAFAGADSFPSWVLACRLRRPQAGERITLSSPPS
ncbi:hypothetical protein TREES_T100003419 [Tupaia chinensis]|uniref:Uncharacterized protein n=1 Tax=Tupaia chinensis TaxID=246437 RepID=L9JFD0_TUPCH|nr:hypothetical protein TREES_T100003419 [Tupaia chinensis]